VTLTRIPAEFQIRYRERGAACSESTEGWTPAEAVDALKRPGGCK
jgi:hypothetical protein